MSDLEKRIRLLERKLERAERNQAELEEQRRKGQILYRKLHDDLQRMQAQLIQAEKLASLGQLTAGIAHEIKNPLNFVNNFAEVNGELVEELLEDLEAGRGDLGPALFEALHRLVTDLKANSDAIGRYGKRADAIVKGMMDHAGSARAERTDIDINVLVSGAVEKVRDLLPDAAQTISVELADALPHVKAVAPEIDRVIIGLVNNALDALRREESGEIRVRTSRSARGVEILVVDNGPGIPEEIRERVFEPFFTTKPTGSGTGLGLSLAYDIVVQGHGGELTFESESGKGTAFRLFLPS